MAPIWKQQKSRMHLSWKSSEEFVSKRSKRKKSRKANPKQGTTAQGSVRVLHHEQEVVAKEPPSAIISIRTLGGFGVLATLVGYFIDKSFFLSTSIVYSTAALLGAEIWYQLRNHVRWMVLMMLVLAAATGYFTYTMFLKSRLVDASTRAFGVYVPDSKGQVWGIPWQPYYYGLQLDIGNPSESEEYDDAEFRVWSDLPLVDFALKTPAPCQNMRLEHMIDGGELTDLTTGTTYVGGLVPNGMVVRCGKLNRHEHLSFLLALYPLNVNRKYDTEPLMPIKPRVIDIEGIFYTAFRNQHRFTRSVVVPDPETADSVRSALAHQQ